MSKFTKKIKRIRLNKICRICLSERGHLRDIIGTKIPTMLKYCSPIQITEDDDMPKQICISCFRQIAKFYTFCKKMERNENILHNYIKNNKTRIKEPFEDILGKAVNDAEIASQDSTSEPVILDNTDTEEVLEISLEDLDLDYDDAEELKTDLNDIIFETGPPPLIPLQSTNVKADTPTDLKALVKDTPPLIPIKPSLVPLEMEKLAPLELKLECTICGDDFNSVSALTQHRLVNCQSTGLQCNVCKKDFTDRKKLIGHLKGHMVAKDYICKICGKRYPNPSTFKVHMRTHTGERPFKCQVCNKGFIRWAGVVGHMKTHNSLKPYKCEVCGKAFKISSNLERHKILHSGSLPYCCNFCGKTFSQADNLQLHIRTYHTFEKPYLCNECGKGFVSSTRLNRHMWVHSGYKPYRCKLCPKAYSNSNDLKNHARTHSGGTTDEDKPHACLECGMRFFHACRLSKHMKIHEKKICPECNKIFGSLFLLNKHIKTKHLSRDIYIDEEEYANETVESIDDPIHEVEIYEKYDTEITMVQN